MRAQRAPLRWPLRLALATILVGSLAGCSAGPEPVEVTNSAKNPLIAAEIQCLAEAGFEGEETWDGALVNGPSVTSGEFDDFGRALESCNEQLGIENFALTDAQFVQLYEQELAEKECLAAEGYDVGEPPSVETFMQTWATPSRWTAWDSSNAADPSAFDADFEKSQALQMQLALRCPPPSWWLQLDGL